LSRLPGLRLIVGGREYDSFRAEEALQAALSAAVGQERADAVELLRGEETSWARVADLARTPSLFAPRRAVVVRNAEAVKGDDQTLLALLERPPAGVELILVAGKVDRRKSLWRRLFESAEVTLVEPLKGKALRAEVVTRARDRGLTLNGEGLDELIERVGQDLRRLVG
jgi:DNA polymerase III delta subunit